MTAAGSRGGGFFTKKGGLWDRMRLDSSDPTNVDKVKEEMIARKERLSKTRLSRRWRRHHFQRLVSVAHVAQQARELCGHALRHGLLHEGVDMRGRRRRRGHVLNYGTAGRGH